MDNQGVLSLLEVERSMRVGVKISHDEVSRITVNKLIDIRKFISERKGKDVTAFDEVLRHFLDKDEFIKYVINEEEIEY